MSSKQSRKRKRPDWKDLPAFLDASASVSASTFGARRLPELKALWNAEARETFINDQIFQSSGGKTSSRHLRRRTTSHKPRKRRWHPRGKARSEQEIRQADSKRPCRRARRKPALLRKQHESWQSQISESCESVNWLTTHVWHAKRFHMHDNLFGWRVPLIHSNRGARAALRMASERHTLLQDVTWRMQPVVIGSLNLETLVRIAQRICPHLLPADNPNAVLSGSRFGQGVLHEPDKFPTGAIGPALWWLCGEQTQKAERKQRWCLHIFVHPAIRATLHELLSELANAESTIEGPCDFDGGLACFQLRGTNATASVKRALAPTCRNIATSGNTMSCTFDWDKACAMDDIHTLVPHLTAVSVQISLNGNGGSVSNGECATSNDRSLEYIDSIRKWNPSEGPRTPLIGDGGIILVSQCPCDPSLPQNAAVCGWDIICHPSDAASVFNALSVVGNSRAIGLVEESLACLECEPPLPVFPRDYPDTAAGKSYWSGDSSDWQLLRQSLERGRGRIHFPKDDKQQPLQAVSWSHISTLPENASTSGSAPVVVRGVFGQPFVDGLAGCGHLAPSRTREASKKRRPRRRVRPPSVSVPLGRLSSDEALAHQTKCEALLQSLSLPALIRCHIRIDGKGTVEPGGRILASMCDVEEQTGYIDFLLGTCVAGSFSITRGLAHGLGFVGAGRLLRVLSSEHGRLSCVAVQRPDGTKHVELKVTVKASTTGSVARNATISLTL